MTDAHDSRACKTCGETKPVAEFDMRHDQGVVRRRPVCKACRRATQREWSRRNQEKVRANAKLYAAKNRERIKEKQAAYYEANRERISARRAEHYRANREHLLLERRKHRLMKEYGLTLEGFDALFEAQGGRCPICLEPLERTGQRTAVDHCHHTGRVRGLLHNKCNTGLGGLGDDPERLRRAIVYLEAAG